MLLRSSSGTPKAEGAPRRFISAEMRSQRDRDRRSAAS